MTGPVERTVDVEGVRLHVREVGDGPPVLLVNGLGAAAPMWSTVERALAGFRLLEFDAPGVGRSPALRYPLTVPALAWLARRVLDDARIVRADVLGYSMGGLVAQQLAAVAPERVRRLVLASTSCGWGGVAGTPAAMLNVATPLRYWSPAFYRRTIGSLAGGRARTDRSWVEHNGQLRRRHPPSLAGYAGQIAMCAGWSSMSLLSSIRRPTLVVTGDDDPLVPAANSVILARRLPEARLLVAPGEGHLMLMDDDSATLRPIREFLAAESLDDAAVWRDGVRPGTEDERAAVAAAGMQAQPWGAMSAMLRALWPIGGST